MSEVSGIKLCRTVTREQIREGRAGQAWSQAKAGEIIPGEDGCQTGDDDLQERMFYL